MKLRGVKAESEQLLTGTDAPSAPSQGPSGGYSCTPAPAAPKEGGDDKCASTATPAAAAPAPDAAVTMAFRRPTREVLMTFLANGVAMMQTDETRQLLQDTSVDQPGQKLIELQRAEWDPLGVDRDFGCNCLDRVGEDYPGDTEIKEALERFCHCAERCYLKATVDRAPSVLETKKPIPRHIIIEFFNACNTQMNLPEFEKKLTQHIVDHKSPPNEIIVKMQRDMLEVFGFEREFGCRQLSDIGKNFKNDQELHQHFQRWQQTAQSTCMKLVKMHMMQAGDAPVDMFGDNPLMKKHGEKAKEQLDQMSPTERGELLQKMQKKIQIFAQLPADTRSTHMSRLSEDDQIEFVKAQILMVSVMKQQWEVSQRQACQHSNSHGGNEEQMRVEATQQAMPPGTSPMPDVSAREAAPAPGRDEKKPPQQMMM